MKYYIIAGERSGDLHASNLMHAIKKMDTDAEFRGMGGDCMEKEGLSLAVHYREMAMMGFVEVLAGLNKVLKYLRLVKKDILDYKPDAVILVDYGSFNMKMARFSKKNGFKVHYYILPKVWAWNQKRVYFLKKNVDYLYSILPFEPAFFKKFDCDVQYVGNPLLDEMEKFSPNPFFHQKNDLNYKPVIALLPGSRKQEIIKMLDTMIKIVPKFPNAQFVIAGVRNIPEEIYHVAKNNNIKVVYDQTYDLLCQSSAAVVTSGTATLETAILRVPQVVVYKTSTVSYQIAKRLIKVPYISLVNLIAEKEVVKELIQKDYNVENVFRELNDLLSSTHKKTVILSGYDEIKNNLGAKSASVTTAENIVGSFGN